jgi:serine protease Do
MVGSERIERALDFERALLGRSAGEQVDISVARGGQPMNLALVLASAPSGGYASVDRTWEALGVMLEPVSRDDFRRFNSRYRGGLKVASVRADGPAAKQGIRRGDVLVGMHIWETISLENVSYILARPDFEQIQPVKFYILRGTETLYGHMNVSAGSIR